MVLTKTYPTLIKQALNTYVSLVNQSPSPHYDVVCASSDQHQQYVVRKLGWKEGRRMSTSVLHVALRDRKIWTSEDWTEDGIATTFLKDGVPSEDMVLGFQPPMMLSFPSLRLHNVLITTRKKRANLVNRLALFFRVCGRAIELM